jgi:hypothetical protein
MHRMAVGFGMVWPMFFHPSVNSFSSIAFMGLPCPTNNTGIDDCCGGRFENGFRGSDIIVFYLLYI